MDFIQKQAEEKNDKKGMMYSVAIHTGLLFFLFLLPSSVPIKVIPKSNIVVELPTDLMGGAALGLKNEGEGTKAAAGKPDPTAGNAAAKPLPIAPPPVPIKTTPVKPVINKPVEAPPPPKKVQTTEDPNAAEVRRQQEDVRKRNEEAKYQQQAAEREKKRQADAQAAAQQEAKRQADAQAAADRATADKYKNRFPGKNGNGNGGGTNGAGGDGTGRGNTGRAGNQGTPDGDPNSSNLNGIGHGPGSVSGFGNRPVQSAPKLQENSQSEGRVVLYVCVNGEGRVVSADFKPNGSTTTDEDLIAAATRNAMQYKFAAGSADKQCGTITYNFKLK